jgi:hypothetical protein
MNMEDALFGNKLIRQYFNSFSQQQWNKVARATMTLGIHQLMKHDNRMLSGDFSQLSLGELEEMIGKLIVSLLMTFVDESDLRLHALARRNKRSKSRDVSKEKTQEASPQRSTPTQTETKKVKKVVMVEDDESMVTASSPVRKEAVVQNSPPAEPAR